MKFLVTGGVGFVGINPVRWLAEALGGADDVTDELEGA